MEVVEDDFIGAGDSFKLGLEFLDMDAEMNTEPGCCFGGIVNSLEGKFGFVVDADMVEVLVSFFVGHFGKLDMLVDKAFN